MPITRFIQNKNNSQKKLKNIKNSTGGFLTNRQAFMECIVEKSVCLGFIWTKKGTHFSNTKKVQSAKTVKSNIHQIIAESITEGDIIEASLLVQFPQNQFTREELMSKANNEKQNISKISVEDIDLHELMLGIHEKAVIPAVEKVRVLTSSQFQVTMDPETASIKLEIKNKKNIVSNVGLANKLCLENPTCTGVVQYMRTALSAEPKAVYILADGFVDLRKFSETGPNNRRLDSHFNPKSLGWMKLSVASIKYAATESKAFEERQRFYNEIYGPLKKISQPTFEFLSGTNVSETDKNSYWVWAIIIIVLVTICAVALLLCFIIGIKKRRKQDFFSQVPPTNVSREVVITENAVNETVLNEDANNTMSVNHSVGIDIVIANDTKRRPTVDGESIVDLPGNVVSRTLKFKISSIIDRLSSAKKNNIDMKSEQVQKGGASDKGPPATIIRTIWRFTKDILPAQLQDKRRSKRDNIDQQNEVGRSTSHISGITHTSGITQTVNENKLYATGQQSSSKIVPHVFQIPSVTNTVQELGSRRSLSVTDKKMRVVYQNNKTNTQRTKHALNNHEPLSISPRLSSSSKHNNTFGETDWASPLRYSRRKQAKDINLPDYVSNIPSPSMTDLANVKNISKVSNNPISPMMNLLYPVEYKVDDIPCSQPVMRVSDRDKHSSMRHKLDSTKYLLKDQIHTKNPRQAAFTSSFIQVNSRTKESGSPLHGSSPSPPLNINCFPRYGQSFGNSISSKSNHAREVEHDTEDSMCTPQPHF
eukprot:GHVL01024370.1.p1 GENE.GHVL01024370.1~~GHVL01024370.1.p1  ORF type:complete len:763 (+),score=118.34 GHVL01024370.1:2445-4733(+)